MPPPLATDPYSEAVLADPYPFQAELRTAAAVVSLPQYGVYAAGRYDIVREIMLRPDAFLSAGGVGLPDIRRGEDYRQPSKINEVDPPEHGGVRSAIMGIFSPRVMRQGGEMFGREAGKLAHRIVAQRRFDGVTDVAETFVFTVFPPLMGVDMPREKALTIAELRFNQSGPKNRLYEQALAKAAPFLEWYAASSLRENVMAEGLAADIFKAEDAGALKPGIGANIVNTLVGGGTDTTIAGIGFTLHYLARNPDQWARVKADPVLLRSAFDEALRLDPPSQIVYRTVAPEGAEIDGLRLQGDRKIAMFLGAANRDPQQWSDPDRFDVGRKVIGFQLGFGFGIHVCLGQLLARMEAEAILAALVERAKTLRPDGEPALRLMNQVRAFRSLPLQIEPS